MSEPARGPEDEIPGLLDLNATRTAELTSVTQLALVQLVQYNFLKNRRVANLATNVTFSSCSRGVI